MTANINCICCVGCIFCIEDKFNRANGDVTIGSPIPWIPPGVFDVVGQQLRMNKEFEILLVDKELDLSNDASYIVKTLLSNVQGGAAIAHIVSYSTDGTYYVGMWGNNGVDGGVIALYSVGGAGMWPDDFTLLNSQTCPTMPTAPLYLRTTVDLLDFLIEVALVGDDVEYTCVAPYDFNMGVFVGIGNLGLGDAPFAPSYVDDFSLCENKCNKGCIIGVDTFERENNVSLGDDWVEHESLPTDISIIGGYVLWQAARIMFWKYPHPDEQTTMGAAFRLYPEAITDIPGIERTAMQPFTIYVCVDDPQTPTTWIEVVFSPRDNMMEIAKQTKDGRRVVLKRAGLAGGNVANPNTPVDFYVCVDNNSRISAYAKDIDKRLWGHLIDVYPQAVGQQLPEGYYCGARGYGVYNPVNPYARWWADQFMFIKTFHPGLPKIYTWTFGGTIVVGDKFKIEITRDGATEFFEYTCVRTDPDDVAKDMLAAILDLDANVYHIIRNLDWYKGAEQNKIVSENQSDFVGIATVKEPTTATFKATKIQDWIKGAYNCPICPEVCPPCEYCDGDAVLPESNAPKEISVRIEGTVAEDESLSAISYWVWNIDTNLNRHNPYGPPWPNMPAGFDCKNGSFYCRSYNGEYILTPCGCFYQFLYPGWYEYYYPDGIPPNDPTIDQDIARTCYPAHACDGFSLYADIVPTNPIDPDSDLVWEVRLLDRDPEIYVSAFWRSLPFSRFDCKKPHTAYLVPELCEDGFCVWPPTITIQVVK